MPARDSSKARATNSGASLLGWNVDSTTWDFGWGASVSSLVNNKNNYSSSNHLIGLFMRIEVIFIQYLKLCLTHIKNYIHCMCLLNKKNALAGVAQWIECRTVNQRVASWIPIKGTCLGCRSGPQWGPREISTTHINTSLPPFPSKNKK